MSRSGQNVIRGGLWRTVVPQTAAARMRSVAVAAPTLLFGITCVAILLKQSYHRPKLADEDPRTADNIDRRAYIALPDGRTALIHPAINTNLSPAGIVRSWMDTLSLLP